MLRDLGCDCPQVKSFFTVVKRMFKLPDGRDSVGSFQDVSMRWLVALPLVLLAAPVFAADPPEVRWPDGTKMTFANLNKYYEQERKTPLKQFQVWMASESFQPLERPSPKKVSGATRLAFLELVILLGSSKDDWWQGLDKDGKPTAKYCLLAKPSSDPDLPTIIGWIPQSLVLTRHVCLEDPESTIKVKAIVVDSLAYLK